MNTIPKLKGRGSQLNTSNRFLANTVDYDEAFEYGEEDNFRSKKTKFLIENPKKVLNKMMSPDLPQGYSLNPYQGCEHGCIYCYARPTHEYYGYSAGLDFEQNIIVKKNAPVLLEKEFLKITYVPNTLLLSGNTDCYQPAERSFELTRAMLKICLKYRNPVSIITKNALILRDLDVLQSLAQLNLLHVIISITSLDETLRRELEPRAVSALKRMQVLKKLTEHGIPVGVNIAPIIPGLNDQEIPEIVKLASENGAVWVGYTMVRLQGAVEPIFENWIRQFYPNKADKVMHQIREVHGGKASDAKVGRRMIGEGVMADHVSQLIKISREKYMKDRQFPPYDFKIFTKPGQLKLF